MASRSPKKRWTPEYAASMLEEAERSGLSDRAFAKRRGIVPQRLWWWRKRLGETSSEKTSFVEVAVRSPTTPQGSSRVEIQLGNGRVVATPVDIDPGLLARLLDAVEGQQC